LYNHLIKQYLIKQERTMSTITVKVSQKNFAKGVKYAKTFGGKYDGGSKTWTIPTHRNGVYNNACNALGNYGLIEVSRSEGSQAGAVVATGDHDGNCPANFGGACECK
jgi:hypothetical protein